MPNRLSELFSDEDNSPAGRHRRLPNADEKSESWTGKIVLVAVFVLPGIVLVLIILYALLSSGR